MLSAVRMTGYLQRAIIVSLALALLAYFVVPEPEPRAPKRPWAADIYSLEEIGDREPEIRHALAFPLFWEGREPVAPVAGESGGDTGAVAEASVEQSALRYVATVIDGASSFAVVRSEESGVKRLSPGEQIDGWDVERIEPALIVLTRRGERLDLEPPKKTSDIIAAQQREASEASNEEPDKADMEPRSARDRAREEWSKRSNRRLQDLLGDPELQAEMRAERDSRQAKQRQ